MSQHLSEEERQLILLTSNEPEFAALPPGQIVPIIADRGLFIGSERSFYRVLDCMVRPPQEPSPVPHLQGAGATQA